MRLLTACLCLLAACFSLAQYPSDKITLLKHYSLSDLQAANGNSCWGYVSPSGREYALMGCDNKVAFIEITDPANPVYFTSIPHGAGLWADLKVYKNALYVCTETDSVGIQVIDLSNIDDHQVTLVRTMTSPGRSHTINVDEVSGFLYCVGANQGTGTTMCFSLANPLNPVRVGSNSLTGSNYVHECQVVTYTSGPNAGRQIMFAGGVQRGFEIWDVTNKSATFLVRRVVYPFVGYCHQGWLSADKKYFYVNDEFDEWQNNIAVRTLVFDVSVLETADLVSTYTNGRATIDHNIYTKNGFIYHSNYTSGFWIYDGNDNPTSPTYRGYIDTFPADDRREYMGTWSNYDFFPSGTCIISDINDGLFIVDVSEATKTPFAVATVLTERGRVLSGGLAELTAEDGQAMVVAKGLVVNSAEAPIRVVFEGSCKWTDVTKVQFRLKHRVNTVGLEQTLELYDWATSSWTEAQTVSAPTADTMFTVVGPNPDRFIEPVTKLMKARLQIRQTGPTTVSDWNTSIDFAGWTVNP